ncbi:polysaccharide pyruvyl transferase family protein [uncultured Limimaricola sp.]|uniref:polysaccharide pyruvyl transferase family protein n=1 Tax=uncultured Limimaricola sp. TaxID=2211667 RepID=UPI0030FC570D
MNAAARTDGVAWHEAGATARLRHVHLIDTACASDNLGDEIIMERCRAEIAPLLRDAYVTTSAGHDGLGPSGRRAAAAADMVLMLGTNALSARLRLGSDYMWRIMPRDLSALRGKVVLVGVGGNRDFDRVHPLQRRLLRHILSHDHVHSVRDHIALRLLEQIGLKGVMTSCPTLWSVPPEMTGAGPARRVVMTLTRHLAHDSDAGLLTALREVYDEVWFWPQQPRDLVHMRSLPGHEGVRVLPPNLAAYDAFLAAGPVDVVGTRLHGTIRGLHHGQRALVVEVDHRAREIAGHSGLASIRREEIAEGALPDRLRGAWQQRMTLPLEAIAAFTSQFDPVRSPNPETAVPTPHFDKR